MRISSIVVSEDLAVSLAPADRRGLAVHRRHGAVLEDAPEPFALVLAKDRLLVRGLTARGDELHHGMEDEGCTGDDVGDAVW